MITIVDEIPLGYCERDGGVQDEGLIAVEDIPFGSPVIATGTNRQVRKVKETDNEITGFAVIPRCRTIACSESKYETSYKEGETVNVVKHQGVYSVKHDEDADLKVGDTLYFKGGKLKKEVAGRPIGRVEKVLSKEKKIILMWIE